MPVITPKEGRIIRPNISFSANQLPSKSSETNPEIQYEDNVPGWLRTVDTKLRNLKVPKFHFAEHVENPVGRFGSSLAEGILNVPSNLADVLTRDYGVDYTKEPQKLKKRLADAAMSGLDIGGFMVGAPAAKTLLQQGAKTGLKQAMKQGAISSGKFGAGFGAAYGGLGAISNEQPIIPSALVGGGIGGLTMGALGAASPAIGAGFRKVFPKAQAPLTKSAVESEKEILEGIAKSLSKDEMEVIARKNAAAELNLFGKRPSREWISIKDKMEGKQSELLGKDEIPDAFANRKVVVDPETKMLKFADDAPTAPMAPISRYVDQKTGKLDMESAVRNVVDDIDKVQQETLQWPVTKVPKAKQMYTSGLTLVNRMGKSGKTFVSGKLEEERLSYKIQAELEAHVRELLERVGKKKTGTAALERVRKARKTGDISHLMNDADEHELLQALDTMFSDVAERAKASGVKLKEGENWIEWAPRKNYLPETFSKKYKNSEEYKQAFIAEAIARGEAKSPLEALRLYEMEKQTNTVRRYGKLEYRRDSKIPGDITDLRIILPKYIQGVSRRLAEIEVWGQSNQRMEALFNQMAMEGWDINLPRAIHDMGIDESAGGRLASAIMNWQMVTKLPLSGFINLTQGTNTVATMGYKAVGKVFKDYVFGGKGTRENMRQLADIVGARERMIVADEMGGEIVSNPNKLQKFALAFFKKSEEFNRFVAANASANRAEFLAKKIASGNASEKAVAHAVRFLDKLGVDTNTLLRGADKELSANQLASAAWYGTKMTQFTITPLSVPPTWRTPLGRIVTQFKSFPFMQTKFIRDEIIKEAAKGNLAPAVRFVTLMPIAYYVATAVGDLVKGKKERKDQDKLIENIQMGLRVTGTLPADILSNAVYTAERLYGKNNEYTTDLEKALIVLGNFLGPTASDLGALHGAAYTSGELQKENLMERPEEQIDPYFYPYGKYLAPKIPYVGPMIKNTYFGEFPKRLRKQQEEAYLKYFETKNPADLMAAFQLDPSVSGRQRFKTVLKEYMLNQQSPEKKAIYDAIKQRREDLRHAPIL